MKHCQSWREHSYAAQAAIKRTSTSFALQHKKAASSDWLLAGKTICFFTVLLTGCGSKLSAAFYDVIGNCRLLILRPALVGLVFGLGVLLRLGKQDLGVLREAQLQGGVAHLALHEVVQGHAGLLAV